MYILYRTYIYTSRTAYDNEMPHSHGAIDVSHISIFICHTYKYTSRTANDNEMSHSHGAIYISHICIFYVTHTEIRHELLPLHMIMRCLIQTRPFVYHTYLYSYVTNIKIRHELLMIMRCLIHVGPLMCAFKKRVSIGLLRIYRALWRIHRSLLRIYKALWCIHRSLLRCVCWVMRCLIHVGLFLWGHPHRKSSCIFTRYVIYDKYDVIHRSLLPIFKALWRIHRSLLRCVCWSMRCHRVCHIW